MLTSVDSITGDCDVTQRKGKVLCIFDLKLQFSIDIEEKNEEEENKKGTASITIPEFIHDDDDYEIEITSALFKQPVKTHLVPILKEKLQKFQPALLEAHAKDVQHASD